MAARKSNRVRPASPAKGKKKAPAPAKKKAPMPAKKKAPAPAKKKAPAPAKKKAPAPAKKKAPAKPKAERKAAPKAQPSVSRAARQVLAQKKAISTVLSHAVDGKAIVDAYLREIDHPFKAEIQAVREIILGASGKVAERIKWNAPSFFYKEDLGAFHMRASEYAHLILLFPGGEGMLGDGKLLEGQHKDRREVKFHSLDDVKAKKRALEKLVKNWVALRDA